MDGKVVGEVKKGILRVASSRHCRWRGDLLPSVLEHRATLRPAFKGARGSYAQTSTHDVKKPSYDEWNGMHGQLGVSKCPRLTD